MDQQRIVDNLVGGLNFLMHRLGSAYQVCEQREDKSEADKYYNAHVLADGIIRKLRKIEPADSPGGLILNTPPLIASDLSLLAKRLEVVKEEVFARMVTAMIPAVYFL